MTILYYTLYFLLFVSLSMLFLLMWYICCYYETYFDRCYFILKCSKKAKTLEEYKSMVSCLDSVSYKKHFWYRLTFRDPMRLYE